MLLIERAAREQAEAKAVAAKAEAASVKASQEALIAYLKLEIGNPPIAAALRVR
jgi:hypothetical protein